MAQVDLDSLSDLQYDVLREIGNIGSGNATTALATMLNIRMDMSVPNVALLSFNEISGMIGSEEEQVVGILLGLDSDIDGMMLFIFDMISARKLVDRLMMVDSGDQITFNEIELSALSEIGNIVAGSYLTALSTLTNLTITSTVPSMTIDMIGALLSIPAIEYGKFGDKILLIQSHFGDDQITGYFLLVPEVESYGKILSSLGVV